MQQAYINAFTHLHQFRIARSFHRLIQSRFTKHSAGGGDATGGNNDGAESFRRR